MIGNCGETENGRKKNGCCDCVWMKPLSFNFFTKTSLMIMALLMVVSVSVLGDDTKALQDTLSSLCSLNKDGEFGDCCGKYDISSVTLDSTESWKCFLEGISFTSDSIITYLFAFYQTQFVLYPIFMNFDSKNLGSLGDGVFSSLTNLMSLFLYIYNNNVLFLIRFFVYSQHHHKP